MPETSLEPSSLDSILELKVKPSVKEKLEAEVPKRAHESLIKAGEFVTALPELHNIVDNPHGLIHHNPLLQADTPAHIRCVKEDDREYMFMEAGFPENSSLTQEDIDKGRDNIELYGISLEKIKDGTAIRVFVPTKWATYKSTPPGEATPRETRYVKTMLYVDLPVTDSTRRLTTGKKPLKGKNILVVGGAGSGLQVTPYIEKELDNLGMDPILAFTPEAENMILADEQRGEGKRLFTPDRAEYLKDCVMAFKDWMASLEGSDWKAGEHAHMKVAEMLREKNGEILFAPTTSNTIGILGSGAVKGPLLLLSAAIATGDVPYYIAPSSEMARDHRVQRQLHRLLNTEPWESSLYSR